MPEQPERKSGTRKWIAIAIVAVVLVAGWQVLLRRPAFDPDRVARAETLMWQAYYTNNKTQLGLELISLLRNQYGLSLLESKKIGELLASSAMKFRFAKGDYERIALPDLVQGYRLLKEATGAAFDPEQVARADLAWWVARRTPGQNSAEQVGEKIAALYALLYGGDLPAFHRAGLLRAQAAELRDSDGANANWLQVEEILKQSYRELKQGL